TDPLPSDVTFQSANPPAGTTFDPTTGVWDVGTVAVRGQLVLTLTVKVNTSNAVQNTATISHADQFDRNPANNTATFSTNALAADLQMLRFIEVPSPKAADPAEFDRGGQTTGPVAATTTAAPDPALEGWTSSRRARFRTAAAPTTGRPANGPSPSW